MKKISLIFGVLCCLFILPVMVDASDYNVKDENDRQTIQNIVPGTTFDSSNNYKPSIGVRTSIKKGETIYFKNSNDWTDVKIYLYEKSTGDVPTGGLWPGIEMTNTNEQIDGHDIYSYQYDEDFVKFNYIIFSGNDSYSNRKQTVNLAYLEGGSYFDCGTSVGGDGKYSGNWYVYDMSLLQYYVDALSGIDDSKDLIDSTSYNTLKDLTNDGNAMLALNNVSVTAYDYDQTLHISNYKEMIYQFVTALNNVVVNTSSLGDAITEALDFDTSKLSNDKKSEFEELIQEATDFKELLDAGSPFYLDTNSSEDDFTQQANEFSENIDNMNLLISKLKAFINDNSSDSKNSTEVVSNPTTGDNIMKMVIVLVISIIGIVDGLLMVRKKSN